MLVFSVVMLCRLVTGYRAEVSTEDGSSMFLQNYGLYLQAYISFQHRRPSSASSLM
jgi:hypothetical protein